jgi:hypothetical protein
LDDQIQKNEVGRVCTTCGERGDVYRVLVETTDRKRLLGRPKHRWENNIKMDIQEMGCECMDWIDVAEDRNRWQALVNAVLNL